MFFRLRPDKIRSKGFPHHSELLIDVLGVWRWLQPVHHQRASASEVNAGCGPSRRADSGLHIRIAAV